LRPVVFFAAKLSHLPLLTRAVARIHSGN
jgi:hypothetical protein